MLLCPAMWNPEKVPLTPLTVPCYYWLHVTSLAHLQQILSAPKEGLMTRIGTRMSAIM